MEKDFHGEIIKFYNKLKNKEYFTFSKYADGEYRILANIPIDILNKCHGEFKYFPEDETDQFYRNKLIESFKYKHKDYYVGIGCPCCMKKNEVDFQKEFSEQDFDHLSYANLWVNSNYDFYKQKIIPLYNEYKTIFVCNNKCILKRLPFWIEKDFRIGSNCWKDSYFIIEDIKKYMIENDINNYLFLFCAGPLGNMLCHQLHELNQNNTYLDIGSTLDPYLFESGGNTRGYLNKPAELQKTCVWE